MAQSAFTKPQQFPLVALNSRPQHHKGDDIFAQMTIRNPHRGRFQHRRMRFQHIVNLPWSNIDSPFDDQLLRSANDKEIAVSVAVGQIARMQPTFAVKSGGRRFRLFVISAAQRLAPNQHFPGFARGQFPPLAIDNFYLKAPRQAGRSDLVFTRRQRVGKYIAPFT